MFIYSFCIFQSENDGGVLKLDNNEEILPIFGNVVVISLKENGKNVEHQVNKVVGGSFPSSLILNEKLEFI